MRIIPLLILAFGIQAPAPEPAGAIRGRITDAGTGAPIAGAVVTLQPESGNQAAVRADENGLYAFTNLASGTYRVSAEPPEFRATYVYASFYDSSRPKDRGAIVLQTGEVRSRVDIELARSVAISGRVVDEWGQPVAGVSVGASARFPARAMFPGRATDDRGIFRVFGLEPGRYFVCTNPGPGQRQQMLGPPARSRSLPTCFPSATAERDALRIQVGRTDVDGVEIQVVRRRTFKVSGTVVSAPGAPLLRASVSLLEWSETSSGSRGVSLAPDGRFDLDGLLPREYVVAAEVRESDDMRYATARAHARVTVGSEDVDGLVLPLVRTARVRGRLIFENVAEPPPAQGSGFWVAAAPPDVIGIPNAETHAIVGRDLTFELAGIESPSALYMLNVPAGWVVQSIKYKGREVVDTAATFTDDDDPAALEILLTRRGGTVTGTVRNEEGMPVAGTRVLLFPADRDKWRTVPPLRPVSPSATGRFGFPAQKAGEYLIAALSADEAPAFPDAPFFERLSKVAQRVVLGEGDRRTVELQVVTLR